MAKGLAQPDFKVQRVDYVGPQVGNQLRNKGVAALIYAMLAILVYVAFRFDFKFGPGALLAMVHDVIMVSGYYLVTRREFNLTSIAVLEPLSLLVRSMSRPGVKAVRLELGRSHSLEPLGRRERGVDVVDAEVGARPALAGLHVGDRRATLVADPGHVVLGRARVRLELPPEERAPELASLRGVVGGDLEVHDLAGHWSSLRGGRAARGCRESSTTQSEYSKASRYSSRIAAPSGARRR